MIIDAQIHVWKASTADRPWPPDAIEPHRAVPLDVPEVSALMAEAGVSGALLLGPTWEGSRNDCALAAAAVHPRRFGAICRYATGDPAEVEKLAHWRETAGMYGIRMSLNRGDVDGMVEAATASGFWSAAQRFGVPLNIYAPGRHALYERLAQRYPALRITVDHAAVESAAIPLVEAVQPLLALAKYPGIAVKASALPCFVREEHPFPSVTETVHRLVDAFGAHRVFFGSDLSRLPVPYPQLVDAFVHHTPRLSDSERTAVLGGALAAWIGWDR
ncbi:amidohydrolase family protein [Streptomyces sp. NPDC059517]|uniref:amidohydrolase family protein n=1 Tax=Streptomyces sp. NPDC059517 TaxID=3346855 RepID=UPI0036BA6143